MRGNVKNTGNKWRTCAVACVLFISHCIILGLCPPTNLTGQVSCDTNTLALTWDQNLVSGATYTLQTEKIGGTLPLSMHTTSNTSHTLTNLLCGQRYAFRIAALDGDCRSSYSPPIGMSTGRMCFDGHICKSFTCCKWSEGNEHHQKHVFHLFQPHVSQPTSLATWTVGQTKGISPGLRAAGQVSTRLR